MHAVSKGFAWHVIRHLLNVTTCACVYLLVAKREEWMLPAVLQMCHYWFYHKGCKSICKDHLNPTKRLWGAKPSWWIFPGSRKDAIKARFTLRFKSGRRLWNLSRGVLGITVVPSKRRDTPPPFAPTVSFRPAVVPGTTQPQPSTGHRVPVNPAG